jgi:DNA invertase Pin-like site-specific DNA recombinase
MKEGYFTRFSGCRMSRTLEVHDPATGRGFLSIMGAIAQMEREIKAERAAAGRAAAKAHGKTGGRPRTDQDKLEQARILYLNSKKSAAEVCTLFGFSRRTLFNYMTAHKAISV